MARLGEMCRQFRTRSVDERETVVFGRRERRGAGVVLQQQPLRRNVQVAPGEDGDAAIAHTNNDRVAILRFAGVAEPAQPSFAANVLGDRPQELEHDFVFSRSEARDEMVIHRQHSEIGELARVAGALEHGRVLFSLEVRRGRQELIERGEVCH
jgi:hypothetical protein